MVFKCVVPNCPSKSLENKTVEKSYSFFQTPAEPKRRREWNRIIPGNFELRKYHKVCEKHFAEDCIVRTQFVKYNIPGIPDTKVTLRVPHLTKTAVPSIFPNCRATHKKPLILRKPFIKKSKVKYNIIEDPSRCPSPNETVHSSSTDVVSHVLEENIKKNCKNGIQEGGSPHSFSDSRRTVSLRENLEEFNDSPSVMEDIIIKEEFISPFSDDEEILANDEYLKLQAKMFKEEPESGEDELIEKVWK